ncbi:hypothetical protein [Embleya sp. NPDC050493]|uniref:hypothetical protein n=1 Tax=Embleya sp. NPDC050493 TaxID=3363989 RepID=UPI003790DD28
MSGRPLPADRWQSVTVTVPVGSGNAGAPQMLTGTRELAALADNFALHVFPGQEHNSLVVPRAKRPRTEAGPVCASACARPCGTRDLAIPGP